MKPLVRHRGICAAIPADSVDTDQIIPSREMRRVSREGLGKGLFAGWRYLYDGREKIGLNSDFVLNQPQFAGTSILLGERNFGCGSSREHAVWALRDYGIRAILAISFGEIFRKNCARNNVLALTLPVEQLTRIKQQTQHQPQTQQLEIDLAEQKLRLPQRDEISFDIAPFDRQMLMQGLDYIDYSLQYAQHVEQFIQTDRSGDRRWSHLD